MKLVWPWLSLIGLTVLAYANAVFHPFVHDDIVFIQNNPHIADFNDWPQIFLGYASNGIAGINTYYRPLLEIAYRLEYHIFGLHAWGYHIVNICLHALNGVLAYHILVGLGFVQRLAWMAALLFLIHPLQTEAVACVAGISNLMMGLLVFSTLLAYINRQWVAALLCFVVALLAKEQALMAIPLVVLIDIWRGKRTWAMWGIFTATALVFLAFRQSISGAHVLADIMQSPGELYLRLAAIARVLLTDIRLVIAPYDLHYYRSTDILAPNIWAWIILVVLMGGIGWLARGRRWIIFTAAWFILALLPVLNVVPLINEYSLILTAEHFLYVPLLGATLAIAFILERLSSVNVFIRNSLRILIITACILLAWHQNNFWRSEITLFKRMAQYEPRFARGHALLGKSYYFNKQYDQALASYEHARWIMEDYLEKAKGTQAQGFYQGFLKGIYFDMAQCFMAQNQIEQATAFYGQALQLDPNDAVLETNYATTLMASGEYDHAMAHLEHALGINPNHLNALNNLAVCLSLKGRHTEAQALWQKALHINPSFQPAVDNLKK